VSAAAATGGLEAAIAEALARVRDPELDEPLPALGFVSSIEAAGGRARVRLRLPTYFCAPNFAYLMVADARAAVLSVPGIEEADIALEDHFADAEVNGAVAAGGGFADAFPGEADGELHELRALFTRKALLVRQARVAEALIRSAGWEPEQLAAMRVRDLPESPETREYLARRAELGLDTSPSAAALVRGDGSAVPPAELAAHLRIARTVRVSVEGNAGLCRSLLKTRYGIPDPEEEGVT
jgi:metal-sulfur cluster biosynthetic enzyme